MRPLSALIPLAASVLFIATVVHAHASSTSTPGTTVNLRIEGASRTIFEDVILSHGRNVTTASGFTLECDGLNHGANSVPGATGISALADAADLEGFSWDGEFFAAFDDIVVTRIAEDAESNTAGSWALLVNFTSARLGGCLQEMHEEDEVLWAFNGFSVDHLLRLDGPGSAIAGVPAIYTVTDGATGVPIADASLEAGEFGTLNNPVSDANGNAVVVFAATDDTAFLKASKEGSIRSNAVPVFVGSR